MRFGSSCLMLGALIRGLSTFPAYEAQIESRTKFWLTFTGHVILAMGHPFLMTLSTKVQFLQFSLQFTYSVPKNVSLCKALTKQSGTFFWDTVYISSLR